MDKNALQFLKTVKQTISDYAMIEMEDSVLVGLSGGPDSVALLWSLHLLSENGGFQIVAAHLNHGLRGRKADEDAEFAIRFANRLNIHISVETADVRQYQKIHKLSLEEAARKVRYDFLYKIARSERCSIIAIGHHADDNAELILMNLLRGSGLSGLSGIPVMRPIHHTGLSPDNVRIVRPLIRLSKREILDFLKSNKLSWQTDQTNMDTRHLRNRVRWELLPQLAQTYNPNIVATLNRLAIVSGEEDRWITAFLSDSLGNLIKKENNRLIVLSRARLLEHPAPAVRRFLRLSLEKIKGDLHRITFHHVESMISMCRSSIRHGSLDLPDQVRIELKEDELVMRRSNTPLRGLQPLPHHPASSESRYEIDTIGEYSLSNFDMTLTVREYPGNMPPDFVNSTRLSGFFDMDLVPFPLIVRAIEPGDKFKPLGAAGTQKLKKYFIDHKIDVATRANIPVLTSQQQIIWVMGHRIDDHFKITPSTKKILKIELKLAEPIEGD